MQHVSIFKKNGENRTSDATELQQGRISLGCKSLKINGKVKMLCLITYIMLTTLIRCKQYGYILFLESRIASKRLGSYSLIITPKPACQPFSALLPRTGQPARANVSPDGVAGDCTRWGRHAPPGVFEFPRMGSPLEPRCPNDRPLTPKTGQEFCGAHSR